MRDLLSSLAVTAVAVSLFNTAAGEACAQTPPTYAPNNTPLVAPGEPLTVPEGSYVPNSTIPNTTVPNGTVPTTPVPTPAYPAPQGGYQVPSGNTFDPPGTVVTPGAVPPNAGYAGGWYPGYWLGFRGFGGPFGGSGAYSTFYNGYGPVGQPGMGGGCNTCPTPCAPTNFEFGRGYDGFMTGW